MSLLTIGEAAARLHTTPSTIRSWERRLGYPLPARSDSGRRLYDESMITLLGEVLSRGLSISSAVRHIREETGAHAELLATELTALRFGAGERLLEAAITMRGICRAFDEIVMDAIDAVVKHADSAGVAALALGWASDRALHYRRLATTPVHSAVVVVDGSCENELLRATSDILQLQLRFQGFATHTLRGTALCELHAVARLANARALLFIGSPPDMVGTVPTTGVSTVAAFRSDCAADSGGVAQLSTRPRAAAEELSALAHPDAASHVVSTAPNGATAVGPVR